MFKEREKYRFLISLACLLIYYSVGVFLLVTNADKEKIITLTPVTLSITMIFLLLNHQKWSSRLVLAILTVSILGFFIEVLGVLSGFPFGSYAYSHVLGIRFFDTPLVMGLNWGMLVYAGTILLHPTKLPIYLKSIITGLILVALDFFIEPFAIKWNLWQWTETVPPWQNYFSWTIVAIIFSFLINLTLEKNMRNKIAIYVLIIQFAFFLILS